MKITDIKINTNNGEAYVCDMYISELGFLMIKLHFPEKGIWKGYNLGNIKDKLFDLNIDIRKEIGKKIEILK